jgi:hypothetical protein
MDAVFSNTGHIRSVAHGRPARRMGATTIMIALAAVLALGACSERDAQDGFTGVHRVFGSDRNPRLEVAEQTAEFVIVPPGRAMVNFPEALLVLERNLGDAVEQRIILPNATAVQGDNAVHIRAQTERSTRLSEFSLREMTTRFGGVPAPFREINEGALRSGQDQLGSFVYAQENLGVGTTCVLVIRRLSVGARPLPRGTSALDVMMRNCVNGTAEQALAPIGARGLAVSGTGSGTIRTISPHAAPQG